VKSEVEQAEVELVTNIEEACKAMKAVVESVSDKLIECTFLNTFLA
jgi:hypothetical protein